jgi:hypothetical protein
LGFANSSAFIRFSIFQARQGIWILQCLLSEQSVPQVNAGLSTFVGNLYPKFALFADNESQAFAKGGRVAIQAAELSPKANDKAFIWLREPGKGSMA